ncbi:MAG: HAD family hydrolase [Planctomycetota bacterium]
MTDDSVVLTLDIDDTIYLERDYARSGFRAIGQLVRERFGYASFGARCAEMLEQGERGNIFDQALRDADLPCDQGTILWLVEQYRAHRPSIVALPDAQTVLQSKRQLAFISDGPLIAQQQKVDALGLARVSDTILLTDTWGRAYWKPHVRAFETVQRRFPYAKGFVYVGDNPTKDFYGPKSLGWQTVRIRRPGGLHYDAPNRVDCLPDCEIGSLCELASLPRKIA